MSVLNFVIRYLLYFCAISGVIMFLPGTILFDITPKAFKQMLPISLDNYTQIDNVNVPQFKVVSNILGPESIALFEGKLVTSSSDGYIYQIDDSNGNNARPLLRVIDNPECNHQTEQKLNLAQKFNKSGCGRPLGIKFDSKGTLFVVEPSFGVYKIENIFSAKPKVSQVFDIQQTVVLEKGSKFLDDIAIEEKKNGGHIFYISDVSSRFSIEETVLIIYGSDMGRIIRYDTDSKKLDIIADNLFFPNGIELSKNNEAVLFTETISRNVWRYNLKGPQKHTLQQICKMLPGELDNIRLSPNGKTFWVAVQNPRTFTRPNELDYYLKKPLLRKVITRVAHMTGTLLGHLGRIIEHEETSRLANSLVTLQILQSTLFTNKGGMLLEIDIDGNLVSSIYSDQVNSDFDLSFISEVKEIPSSNPNERVIYLGSYNQPLLRKLTIVT